MGHDHRNFETNVRFLCLVKNQFPSRWPFWLHNKNALSFCLLSVLSKPTLIVINLFHEKTHVMGQRVLF